MLLHVVKFEGKAMCGVVVSTVLARDGVERHTSGCTGYHDGLQAQMQNW
jgi:hypothetical protein